jgi:hypothetical protein
MKPEMGEDFGQGYSGRVNFRRIPISQVYLP